MEAMQSEVAKRGKWEYYHLPALTDAGLLHGFFTKTSSPVVSDPGEREELAVRFSLKRLIILDQLHGDKIHVVGRSETPEQGDGLLLTERGTGAIIKTADCLPVILFDPASTIAVIVHAGWRGTIAKIAGKATDLMVSLGSKREAIQAVIGPGIGPCCYEIQDDVATIFREAGFDRHIIGLPFGKMMLDLKAVNRHILHSAGVSRIYGVGLCTSCRQDLFFSARKNGREGRQINLIALT